ncbi:MAG: PHB depolymerase family esterase [Pseudomonadota bacterium]|nr:PHB depolymerase family esterase [Pseudomonadota bacterium]
MNAADNKAMAEATRLTREGKLEEATALLLGAARNVAPANGPTEDASALQAGPATVRRAVNAGRGAPGAVRGALAGLVDRVVKAPLAREIRSRNPEGGRPSLVPGQGSFQQHRFSNIAGSRTYKLYIPAGSHAEPLPMVVMLHGCTQAPDDFAAGTGMNALADELKFLVVYPAQDASANPQRCWNWFSDNDQQRDRGEPSLIAGITRQVMREQSVDPRRVYVAGLSAGGAAAAIMGSAYPDLYAAIGVHSGLACGAASDMPSAFAAMRQGAAAGSGKRAARPVATIVFHGDSDSTVSPINGEQVIEQSKASSRLQVQVSQGRSAGGVAYTRTVQLDDEGQALLEHWLLHGGGHAWSGGSAAGSYTDPRGPDASREMLRFFLQHRLA